jgi:hypothetical protein
LRTTEHKPQEAVVIFNVAEDMFDIEAPLFSFPDPFFTFQ